MTRPRPKGTFCRPRQARACVCACVRSLTRATRRDIRWLSALQEQMLQNEHQAAIFVQQQVRKFFERQKHQLLALKAQADTSKQQ